MSDVQTFITVREKKPPHRVLGNVPAGEDLRYGFAIGGQTPLQLQVSRDDPNAAAIFEPDNMITIERVDGLHPWVGTIQRYDGSFAGATATLDCADFPGGQWGEDSHVAKDWSIQEGASGAVIRRIFVEAEQRGDPPTLVELPSSLGPVVHYQPEAEPIIDFLQTMVEWTDWEFGLEYSIDRTHVLPRLIWTERLGSDMTKAGGQEMIDGVHFISADFGKDRRGWLKSTVAIAGGGALADRPSFRASAAGTADGGMLGTVAVDAASAGGSRVILNSQISNAEAAEAAAKHQHHSTEFMGHSLKLTLFDGTAVPDGLEAFPMEKLELGSRYRIRVSDIVQGESLDTTVRLVAYSLGLDGKVECTAQVLRELTVVEG